MTEIQDQTDTAQELDDFDVEGHGLKEVAAIGLSAATIAAGASAALALDNPAPGTTRGVTAAVAGVQGDVNQRTGWAQSTAGGVASDATTLADRAAGSITSFADRTGTTAITAVSPIAQQADQAVSDAADLAGDVVSDPFGSTDEAVDGALTDVRSLRDGAVDTAKSAVTDATRIAGQTAGTADRAAADAVNLAGNTASSAYQTLNPKAGVTTSDDGTTVSAEVAGKGASATVR